MPIKTTFFLNLPSFGEKIPKLSHQFFFHYVEQFFKKNQGNLKINFFLKKTQNFANSIWFRAWKMSIKKPAFLVKNYVILHAEGSKITKKLRAHCMEGPLMYHQIYQP